MRTGIGKLGKESSRESKEVTRKTERKRKTRTMKRKIQNN